MEVFCGEHVSERVSGGSLNGYSGSSGSVKVRGFTYCICERGGLGDTVVDGMERLL